MTQALYTPCPGGHQSKTRAWRGHVAGLIDRRDAGWAIATLRREDRRERTGLPGDIDHGRNVLRRVRAAFTCP